MSEDTAHGQHFEPAANGEAKGEQQGVEAALPEMTIQEALDAQVNRVQTLAIRVGTLINTTQDAFREFVMESAFLFNTLEAFAKEAERSNSANRPTDGPTTQASA